MYSRMGEWSIYQRPVPGFIVTPFVRTIKMDFLRLNLLPFLTLAKQKGKDMCLFPRPHHTEPQFEI
jgi:hypothetical protein